MRNHTYTSPGNERMDISFFNYFSTVSLGLMCYSVFKPKLCFNIAMFCAYGFARTVITTHDMCHKYIYMPYKKYIKTPLMKILNIDNGLYEIEIVKDGKVIHRFKTMSDFIAHNTIKFINDDDLESGSDSDSDSKSDSQAENTNNANNTNNEPESHSNIETPVDADLTQQDINIHEVESNIESSSSGEDGGEDGGEEGGEEGDEEGEDDESEDTDETDNADDYNLILEPSEYDFVLRNIYIEDDTMATPFGYCLKYETFRKSDMKRKSYEYADIKNMTSKRRFIGIHLKTEEKEFIINLTNPINYYLVNNTILDYSFLKMYLFNRYNFNLGNTYKLSCIDNFVEMYTIEQGKKFFVKSNAFKIVEDETYKVEEECGTPITFKDEDMDVPSQNASDALTEADIEIVECNYSCQ